MHICIIAPEQFPLPGDGSVEICIWAIARRLAGRHKVTVVSRATALLPDSAELEQVRIIRLASGTPRRYQASVLQFLQQESFDIIQVDNRPLLMAAVKERHPGTPVLLYLHSLTFVPAGRRIARSLARADGIAVNSRSLLDKLSGRFPGIHRRLSVVPLGAELSRFTPAELPERQRLRRQYRLPQAFTVLFAGRIIPRKGVPVLIRAMYHVNKRLPAHLVVAGQGKPAYIRQLKLLARRLGVSVSFPGKIAHEQIHSLYQAADCFVCPSQRHEAFGLVNVEAMASGLPVIASDNGGIREIIRSGHNGYLTGRYRQALPFARLLLKVGKSPGLAARIGLQGRSDALRTFDWNHTASRLEELYQSFLHA
ncbi:spore coat protein [Paenibacillus sp. FSL R7-0273]|uniref:glycosyltransferase family 4 protein n=1 Tax=Paenibacillus sp. FSL R7-0273 TaxID=1536772 RepID=UPI0004F61119|nr:glycosyltransferase family 4 protein [Paenibacillus sp. FSL R7-0273]AIQ44728.1 spore coat protein [Paenibacillus sp. FSL R7-0273]OMF93409.1 spore coat protein [Paenibacillus sp. FSL R7-0273]